MSLFKRSKLKTVYLGYIISDKKILDYVKRSQLTVRGRPQKLMPLSIRLQKKRSSNSPDLFSPADMGLTDKNNSAEVDGRVQCKTASHDTAEENRAMQKSTWHIFKWVRTWVIREITLLM